MSKKSESDSKPVIPRQRASVICLHQAHLLLVQMQDPGSGREYLFPPGGRVEPGETPAQAARRETREETGYQVELLSPTSYTLAYDFPWHNQTFACVTDFFWGQIKNQSPEAVHDAAYNQGVVWLPKAEWERRLNYHPLLCTTILNLAETFPST